MITSGTALIERFFPGAPACLPRLRSTSSLRFAFSAARRSDRVLVASACCLGLSLDGARDEIPRALVQPLLKLGDLLRVRSSICSAC